MANQDDGSINQKRRHVLAATGSAAALPLAWMSSLKVVEATPVVQAYVDRVMARPGVRRARELDRALLADAEARAGSAAQPAGGG